MKLGYGETYIDFEPVGRFEVLLPAEMDGLQPECELNRALDNPYGPSLESFRGAKDVVILVSDITRPAPTHLMLPPLVTRLKSIGVDKIKVVFALGTHRAMTRDEERLILGGCINLPHRQHDKNRCITLGKTSRGTPVEILEEANAADLIVATGNIEYHYYAGYSGGAKALLPGISSERSVIANHMMMRDPKSRSGRLDSPVRLDMEEAAKIGGLDFILNVVLNSKKEIVRAVSGNFVQAHKEGAKVVDQMYQRPVKPAEIVITSVGGYPKDINLFQAQKAMDNAKEAVLPGGTLILVAKCSEGLGNKVFERWAFEAVSPEDCIDRFGREYEFGGHKAAFIAMQSLKHDIVLVSNLSPKLAEMCFFKPADSLESAYKEALDRYGKDARTIIMPYGGLTLAKAELTARCK